MITEKGVWLMEMEIVPVHVQLLVGVDPLFGIHELVEATECRSSGVLREEFPWLTSRLSSLWTHSYFVATVGGAPLSVIKRFVGTQRDR